MKKQPILKLGCLLSSLGIALLSFCWIIACWFRGYTAEYFLCRTLPFALMGSAALIAAAILCCNSGD